MSARESVRRLFESAMMNARAVISEMKTRVEWHQHQHQHQHHITMRDVGREKGDRGGQQGPTTRVAVLAWTYSYEGQ